MLSADLGELRDAIAIFAIIGAVTSIETATEWGACKALTRLRSLTAPGVSGAETRIRVVTKRSIDF